MEDFINVNYIKMVDSVIQDFYVITNCLLVLSIIERLVFKYSTIIVDLSISSLSLSVISSCTLNLYYVHTHLASLCVTDLLNYLIII